MLDLMSIENVNRIEILIIDKPSIKVYDNAENTSLADQLIAAAFLLLKIVLNCIVCNTDKVKPSEIQKNIIINGSILVLVIFYCRDDQQWVGECFSALHLLLGKRKMCGWNDAKFLEFGKQLHKLAHNRELYQCYACMYGLIIKVDGDMYIDQHNTEKQVMSREAAKDVFDTVSDHVQSKINSKSYRQISADTRACFEKISKVFSSPPWKNGRVILNKSIITKFLESDIDLRQVNTTGNFLNMFCFDEIQRRDISRTFKII